MSKIERFIYKDVLIVKMANPNKSASNEGVIGAYSIGIPGYMGALKGDYQFTVEVDPKGKVMWVGSEESEPYHHHILDKEGNLIDVLGIKQDQIGQILKDVMKIKGKKDVPLETILEKDKRLVEKVAADVKAYKPPL